MILFDVHIPKSSLYYDYYDNDYDSDYDYYHYYKDLHFGQQPSKPWAAQFIHAFTDTWINYLCYS